MTKEERWADFAEKFIEKYDEYCRLKHAEIKKRLKESKARNEMLERAQFPSHDQMTNQFNI